MKQAKEFFINQCLELLRRQDIKQELKDLMKPLIEMMFVQIYPYIFIFVSFSLLTFFLMLGIFILLMRNKIFINKKT